MWQALLRLVHELLPWSQLARSARIILPCTFSNFGLVHSVCGNAAVHVPDMRVSTLPGVHGESIVLHGLDNTLKLMIDNTFVVANYANVVT